MNLNDILVIMQNKLINLGELRKSAFTSGNLEQVVSIDAEILSTENSIQQLKTTLGVS